MSTASDLEWLMLALINQERTARGLDPLQLELRLNASSEDHSSWMLQTDTFSHTGAGGSSAGQRMADAGFTFSGAWGWAENIALQSERGAAGYADDVADLHVRLMNSSGHRANILNPNYEVIGIGIEVGNYNGWEAVTVTQNFAYTGATVQLDTPDAPPPPPPPDEPDPEPDVAAAPPVLAVGAVTLDPGSWTRFADAVEVRDSEGDTPDRYLLRDKTGLVEYALGSEVLTPVNGNIVIQGSRLDELLMRTDEAGIREQLLIRARDDDGWGKWETFNTLSTPEDDRPLVGVENMVFSEDRNTKIKLADEITVLDSAGDEIVWYQLLDRTGRDNFVFKGQGAIQADTPYLVMAEDLDQIRVRGETDAGKSYVKVRAFDGETVSGWETFVLNTVPDDDPLLAV